MAIGATLNDGNGSGSGHVRVYEESGGVWSQVASDIDGEAAWDQSGRSVSLSSAGTHVAIAAIQVNGIGSASGHARVYKDATLTAIIPVGLEGENSFYITSVFADQKQLSVTFNLPFYKEVTATLYDLNGRLIADDKRFSYEGLNTLILDIGSLPAGVYVVHLWNGKTGVSEKFVKP